MALSATGKFFYGATFLIGVPLGLTLWARATSSIVPLPTPHSPRLGSCLVAAGILLMIAGMRDLWRLGGGLPMNAAPPPRYVNRGAYALVPHPIYLGFTLGCAGVSIWTGSASGLWLITPTAVLGCVALVLGYEHHDLCSRFGRIEALLPADNPERPSIQEIIRGLFFGALPWAMAASALLFQFHPSQQVFWSNAFFILLFTALPLFASRSDLRHYQIRGFAAIGAAFCLFLALPLLMRHTSFKALDLIASPCAVCALLSFESLAQRLKPLLWILRSAALAAAFYLAACGPFSRLSTLLAVTSVMLAAHSNRIWRSLRASAEYIANSWVDWRLGSARFIYHGLYAGAGGFLMVLLAIALAGPDYLGVILFASCCAVLGAALWAQLVEGSHTLLRPFGFYGGLIGGVLGCLSAPLFHKSWWLLLAAISAGGLWAQALGRLRCLVQGCCHGQPAPAWIGIRYTHPNSRVLKFTHWAGVHLHPTPVYSIIWNAVGGLFLLRLWSLHVAASLIIGLYFILSGIERFAEEGWRGEPQTKFIWGLKIYQWTAVTSVLLGMLFTVIGPQTSTNTPQLFWSAAVPAVLFGVIVACAMGLDFPDSNHRFSRLT